TGIGMPASGITIKQGDAELCAIYLSIKDLPNSVNVGLMMFNPTQSGNQGGSYVRFAMSPMTSTNITNLKNTLLMSVHANANKIGAASANAYEDKMNDAFRYFNSLPTLRSGLASGQVPDANGYSDSPTDNNFKFITGQNGDTCGFDYIIFIGNGFPGKGP